MKNSYILFLIFNLIPIPDSKAQSIVKTEITNWVNKNCIPIKDVTAENGFEDLKPLDNLIGDATIVALGECTHGSSEIFSMKHRMLEYLVKEKGFTMFSIEANMPEAYALNRYIINGEGDPKKLLAGMYFWTWNTQEVLDMIEWMKKYNDTSKMKIMFTGFDMQIPIVAVKIVRDFATIHQPSLLSAINDYDTLYLGTDRRKDKKKSTGNQLQEYAQLIIDGFNTLQTTTGDTTFLWALQNSRILLQYAKSKNGKADRDESMAENVKWILDQNPKAKMVIWAHNQHLRKEKNKFGVIRMGDYLNKSFGDKYIAIATTTEQGTYTAVKKENGKFTGIDSANVLTEPDKNDIEYYFKQSKYENFILDLRKSNSPFQNEKIMIRDIGAIANDKFQFVDSYLGKEYDMIIFLKKTSSSKCFSITHTHKQME